MHLYKNREDRAFITTMGIYTSTFDAILEAGFGRLWYTQPITRRDKLTAIHARGWIRSLDTVGGLGLVLHWLSSTMRQVSLQQIFALVPSTVSRYLCFALSFLLKVLRQMPHVTIAWPRSEEFLVETELEVLESSNRITGHTRSSAGTRSGVTIVL